MMLPYKDAHKKRTFEADTPSLESKKPKNYMDVLPKEIYDRVMEMKAEMERIEEEQRARFMSHNARVCRAVNKQ